MAESVLGSTLAYICPNAEVTQGVPLMAFQKLLSLKGHCFLPVRAFLDLGNVRHAYARHLLIDGILRLCLEASSSVFGLYFIHKLFHRSLGTSGIASAGWKTNAYVHFPPEVCRLPGKS